MIAAKENDGIERMICRGRRGEYIPRLAVTDDLDANLIAHGSAESALDEVLVHPVVKIAHPVVCELAAAKTQWTMLSSYQRVRAASLDTGWAMPAGGSESILPLPF